MKTTDFDRRLSELVRRRRGDPPPRVAAELHRRLQAEPVPARRLRRLRPLPALRLAAAAVVALFGLGVGAALLLHRPVPLGPALAPMALPRPGNRPVIPIPACTPAAAAVPAFPATAPRPAVRPLSSPRAAVPEEIRTELEIAGKDIRIIWVQKPDFFLRRNPS